MMAEAVRFYVVPSDWQQVRGVEMVGDSEGRVERRECVDGVRSVCTCWTRELEWFVLSAEQGYPFFGNLTCRATCRAACHNCHLTACRRFVSTNSLLFLPFPHLPQFLNKQTVAI